MKQAHERARATGKPILVRAGAPWCGWCRKLDAELSEPIVQSQLSRWTLLYLDVEAQPEEARRLAIGPIPAFRLLSPSGTLVAEHNGFIPAAELATWLQQSREKIASAVPERLLTDGPIDVETVTQLVARLNVQDPGTREAIIRRLTPHREQAGRSVTAAFLGGTLATRLSALELLSEWKAPINGLDPWSPQTLSESRLAALIAWSQELQPATTTSAPATRPAASLESEDQRSGVPGVPLLFRQQIVHLK
jgi:hypothetical protein